MMDRYELETLWSKTLRRSHQSEADIDNIAGAILEVLRNGDDRFVAHLSNRIKDICAKRGLDLPSDVFDLDRARLFLADELGFPDWASLIDSVEKPYKTPLIFKYAVAAMERGDFSSLESTIGGPASFHETIVGWYLQGYFDDEPETLAEVFSAACMLGHDRTAGFLLDKGVDPLAGMRTGLNGFHYAASSGRLSIVKLLIARKVPMEVENMYGGTVFGQAMWSAVNEYKPDHAAIVEALVEAGAVVDDGYQEWWAKQEVPDKATKERIAELLKRYQKLHQDPVGDRNENG